MGHKEPNGLLIDQRVHRWMAIAYNIHGALKCEKENDWPFLTDFLSFGMYFILQTDFLALVSVLIHA